jgi:hypothetical protein
MPRMKLTATERRLAGALFDEIVPHGDGRFPLSATEAGVLDYFEDHLDYMPTRTRWALRAAVGLLGTYARAGGRLHPGGMQGALESLGSSRLYSLRETITLLKSVVAMAYFTHPRVRAALGLDLNLSDTLPRKASGGAS